MTNSAISWLYELETSKNSSQEVFFKQKGFVIFRDMEFLWKNEAWKASSDRLQESKINVRFLGTPWNLAQQELIEEMVWNSVEIIEQLRFGEKLRWTDRLHSMQTSEDMRMRTLVFFCCRSVSLKLHYI